MRSVFAALAGVLAMSGCQRDVPSTPDSVVASVIPAPMRVVPGSGKFTVTSGTTIRLQGYSPADEVARYFADLLGRTAKMQLSTSAATRDTQAGAIRFAISPDGPPASEGYRLEVSNDGILVTSSGERGLFYGAVTLWALIVQHHPLREGDATLPGMTIDDAPRFAWRGLMLDSARHYHSPAFVKQLIDWMALHKLNVLHWHLTDDQGWRLEIKKYPKLTSVGAWRVPAGPAAAADIDPATGKPRLYGGFYTQAQVREIVAHAAARHVTIVPEIEMPGHATAAIVAYPSLGVINPAPSAVPADWGIYANLYNADEATFAFLEDVLAETMELFPGQYIHVGGDEAVKDQWRASPRVQARMRELHLADEHALQSYFIQRMEKFVNAHGRRLIGWDEILEGGLAPNATVMSWRGIDGAVAASAAGHDVVLSPWPLLYFDNRPLDAPSPPGRGRIVSTEDVYRFDPEPPTISPERRQHVLGLQANLWTEHIRTEERLEYMAFPRAAAVAEIGWSQPQHIDWADFSARLPAQLERYQALGIHYAAAVDAPPIRDSGIQRRTSHQLASCTDKLVLSLEDDAPVRGERAIFLVDLMNPCWLYKAADLSRVTTIDAVVGQVPFNFQIGKDIQAIPLRKPRTTAGELEVHLDGCDGSVVATLPLAPAAHEASVTRLPPATVSPTTGTHDLCLTFTQSSVDPTWVIDSIELK